MTTYTVKNDSPVDKAFRVYGGHKIIAAGKKGEVEMTEPLTEAQISALELDGCEVVEKKAVKKRTEAEIIASLSAADKAEYEKRDPAGKAKFLADKVSAEA